MSGRSISLTYLAGLFFLSLAAPLALAQEAVQVQPDVQNSRVQFTGSVNSPDVYVRSGPGEAWYATQKLPQGTQVTVVGIKFDWLKILPPPGSYCLVSKLYIERRGDGSVGRASRSDINVRAGSDLTAVKTTVLNKLSDGDDVKILGEEDEYYKIQAPAGTYFYVNKQFVDPIHALAVNAAPVDTVIPTAQQGDAAPAESSKPDELAAVSSSPGAGSSTTQPAMVSETPATTQPAVAETPPAPSPADVAAAAFTAAETQFNAASQKPLEDQPAADLAKQYSVLINNQDLSDTQRQTAGFRLAVLKVRLDAQARLADVNQIEVAAAARDKVLKAEQDELQKRLDAKEVKFYAAVGTLQASSLQFGSGTLYRLTDPANSRTLVYLHGADNDQVIAGMIGKFVGVRGDAVTDDQLHIKVIPYTLVEAVDPADVNTKVMAQITPPSISDHAIQASAAGGN